MTGTARRRFASVLARPDADLVLGLAAAGLAVRLALVLATMHHNVLSADARDYLRLGHSLARGHGWGRSLVAPGGGPEGYRPPGYPIWLAGVLKLTGGGLTTVRLLGAALGAVVPALVAVLARQIGWSRRTAAVAGGITVVLPSLVIASIAPMSESLFVPMSLGVIVAAMAFRRSGRVGALATSGALLGLATLVRPVGGILVIPVVAIAVSAPRTGRRKVAAALAIALAVVPCAAWEIRQVDAFHAAVPLTTQGGFLLAGTYDSASAQVPGQAGVWLPYDLDPSEAALVARHPTDDEAQVSGLLDHAAVRYATHHPGYDVTVLTDNTLRLFDLSDPDFERRVTVSEYGVPGWLGTAEQVGGLSVLVLAVAGLAQAAVRRRDWAVWMAPLVLLLVTIPVQSYTRFRAPVDPYLALLAAFAITSMLRRRTRAPSAAAAPQPPAPQPTPLIGSLTSLRFAAALLVFGVHTAVLLGPLFPHSLGYGRVMSAGATGVGFFFVLSGFVLTWSRRPDERGREFVRRRAARILPNHVLTWAATALLYSAIGLALPTGPALSSLFLVHAWVPIKSWFNGMDTPSWSLCCEALFYVLFPLLLVKLRALSTQRLRLVVGLGLLVPLAAAVVAGPLASVTSPQVGNWIVVDFPVARLAEFVLGIAVALELTRGTLPRISPAAAAAAVAVGLVVVDLAHTQHLLVIVTLLPFAAGVAAAARAELDGRLRWLRHPWAIRLGQWSFAFYLVHWLVLVVALRLHPHPFSAFGAVAAVVLSLLASITVSAGVFMLWERPMERALRPRHEEPLVTAPAAATAPATP